MKMIYVQDNLLIFLLFDITISSMALAINNNKQERKWANVLLAIGSKVVVILVEMQAL